MKQSVGEGVRPVLGVIARIIIIIIIDTLFQRNAVVCRHATQIGRQVRSVAHVEKNKGGMPHKTTRQSYIRSTVCSPPAYAGRIFMLSRGGRLPAHSLPVGRLDVFKMLGGHDVVNLFNGAVEDDQRVSATTNN